MRVVVCAIAKNENLYINDWVNWYLRIGFDHIYLFDNNEISEDFVGDSIDNINSVTIFNVRGVKRDNLQYNCYNRLYNEQKDDFDWCLFCDIDEFLFGVDDIKKFLRNHKFENYDQIRITWKTFSDNGMILRDLSVPVYDAFKEISKNKNLHKQSKSIVRGHIEDISVGIHRSTRRTLDERRKNQLRSCLPSGLEIENNTSVAEYIEQDISNETVFMNHYMTKSLSEFIKQKIGRGNACKANKEIGFDYYWKVNEKTEEKEDYIKNYLSVL